MNELGERAHVPAFALACASGRQGCRGSLIVGATLNSFPESSVQKGKPGCEARYFSLSPTQPHKALSPPRCLGKAKGSRDPGSLLPTSYQRSGHESSTTGCLDRPRVGTEIALGGGPSDSGNGLRGQSQQEGTRMRTPGTKTHREAGWHEHCALTLRTWPVQVTLHIWSDKFLTSLWSH